MYITCTLSLSLVTSEAHQLMNNPNHPVLLSENFSKSHINSKRFHHNFTKSHYSVNRNNFVDSVPSIWNALNSVSKFRCNFSNTASFKKAVKEFLLNIQSYGISNYWEPVNFSVFNYISATLKYKNHRNFILFKSLFHIHFVYLPFIVVMYLSDVFNITCLH